MGVFAGGLACEFAAGGDCGFAACATQKNAATTTEIAGRGRERDFINAPVRLQSEIFSAARRQEFKIRAATAIHPNAFIVIAPRAVLRARAATALLDETNAPARFCGAIVAPAVVGRAVKRSDGAGIPIGAAVRAVTAAISSVAMAAAYYFEIGAATAIHPDAATLLSPCPAFDALRFAVPLNQANCAVRTGVAGVTVHVVGIAGDADVVRLVLLIGIGVAAGFKFSAAATINPNPALIVAPSRTVNAIGFTALAEKANPAGGVSLADVPAHIIGRAGNRLGLRRTIAADCAKIEVRAAALIDPDSSP